MKTPLKAMLLLLSCTFTLPIHAFDGIIFYGTTISNQDRFNSSGDRLTSVRSILRQDRANMHKYGHTDAADQYDSYFANPNHRQMFNHAKLKISQKLSKQIKSGRPVNVSVFIYPGQINVVKGLPTPGTP